MPLAVWPPTIAAEARAAIAVAFDPSCAPAPEADAATPFGSVRTTEIALAAPVALPPKANIAAPCSSIGVCAACLLRIHCIPDTPCKLIDRSESVRDIGVPRLERAANLAAAVGQSGRLVYTAKQQMCDAARALRLKIDALAARYQHRAGSRRDGETVVVVR